MAENSSNNAAYFIIGALVVAVAVLGYFMFFAASDEPDLSISVGGETLEVDVDD